MSKYAVMPLEDYQNACEKIRDRVGVTDLIKSGDLVDQIEEVYNIGHSGGYFEGYEQGKQEAGGIDYDLFWDTFQENGNRKNYQLAFANCWNDEIYNPKYPINCTTTNIYAATSIFANSTITDTKVPIIIDGTRADSVFQDCEKLKTIRSLTVENIVRFSNTFRNCKELEELNVYGTIGVNGFDVSLSTKLTHHSLISIINALKDFSQENTLVNDLTLPASVPSSLGEYTLIEGKTYVTSFCDITANPEKSEFIPTYQDFSAVAQNISVYGVGDRLGMHYTADCWASSDYIFNLVVYQDGNEVKELRYLENKNTGSIMLNGQAGDRIIVKIRQEDIYTVTLGATNLNKLTEEEKAVATKKGWGLQ